MKIDPIAFADSTEENLGHLGEKPFYFSTDKRLSRPLYRYTKRCYFDEFVATGQLRLSTLWSYHDELSLGTDQGDRQEGLRSFHPARDGILPNGVPVVLYGNTVNQWTLCATAVRDSRFYPKFEADCCFQINSLKFFSEIAAAARLSAVIGMVCKVDYVDTTDLATEFIAAISSGQEWQPSFLAATKDARFEWQNEVRLLLEPPQRNELRSHQNLKPELRHTLTDEIYNAMLDGRERELLDRPELYPDLQPLFVDASAAVQYVELIESK